MKYGCRKCRREGVKLFLKGEKCFSPKCPITRRPYAPGEHGPSLFTKLSEYGKQLREKQKVKKIYNLGETQLKNYYLKAGKKSGDTSENLVRFLEARLDSIIYRLGVAASRSMARQMVSHNNFLVNGKNVNIPSFIISDKDEIRAKENKKIKVDDKIKLPSWLSFDQKKQIAKLKHLPTKDELELPFDINLVIEYYSR
ncbi:30S ribosomal protein S4 [Candidatus Berkelbacteria bacterium CG_4_9_14_0_2_um_filter_42_30]|uniref:Small ribosomal subunit protein uS4 n=6 Tax=Candidatus Berkelbacteria TaxID=1618330 RepID=A0A2M7K1J0_9BACT|nr:MAG: 30S ribosomal protein S4 [Candidatus Berkelbacteria bacterium CG1_02_42_45]PIP50806.1 MAG: 30S ribosomal protein S4 [Candidatus Berkelbacteria bacterium CG23_combo_of_CG06-09_8_20_14_all_41_73]PIR27507.1 MAG: 30S ribosomal protein S4 [Candidatus Berkelbacteria bacterium CG11_big_fil_rev_8_21_14_0_20_42_15]PIX30095.1 MAG: 30S ribosomal protein S4 [Candidatus Berkelbacteria bacterium CG_4_8_14_3_um_filter_42_13]PIZ27576.1 MAG: 30S ribosomal protein S4 [Candidatus Berkelbacteria bacterium 